MTYMRDLAKRLAQQYVRETDTPQTFFFGSDEVHDAPPDTEIVITITVRHKSRTPSNVTRTPFWIYLK